MNLTYTQNERSCKNYLGTKDIVSTFLKYVNESAFDYKIMMFTQILLLLIFMC